LSGNDNEAHNAASSIWSF